ncbi:MAG: ATP-binding protein [Bacteroidota bacterium]
MTELILQRIRLLSQRRVCWLRNIWADLSKNEQDGFTAHTEIDGYLLNRDIATFEREYYERDPAMKELSGRITASEEAIFKSRNSRLAILSKVFGLSRFESDILQICFAFGVDPNLGRVFAYLQDHSGRAYVTEALVAKLFGYGESIVIPSDSPLKVWRLVRESVFRAGEPGSLECDPFIRNWLLGENEIDETLVGYTSVQPVFEPLRQWPVERTVYEINKMNGNGFCNQFRVFVAGAEGSGRRSFAAIASQGLGLPLLSLDADRIPETSWNQVYLFAQRQAFLSGSALAWYGDTLPDRYWSSSIPSYPVQFVTGGTDDHLAPAEGFLDLRVILPRIGVEERLALWKKHVPASGTWPQEEMLEMLLRHETTIRQIVTTGKKMISTIPDTCKSLNADSARILGSLARHLTSEFTFDDLVLPDNTREGLEDFIFEASERILFWEQPNARRLFPQGRSLIGLFTGSPGTGKTMAAQVIAASLKLDLFRIDLSLVVSKYVGETSKNIERLLSRASNMNLVLLFDEADSLFGKRTEIKDAHDRYGNTDTNYLLQAIESYPGIILLASNRKSNIDSGFMRRFRYQLDFPRPDAEQRNVIWRKIIGELAGEMIVREFDQELFRLAGLVEITGAQIKQSVLSAIFMARRGKCELKMTHLLRGLERELAKEGKGLGRQVYQNFS